MPQRPGSRFRVTASFAAVCIVAGACGGEDAGGSDGGVVDEPAASPESTDTGGDGDGDGAAGSDTDSAAGGGDVELAGPTRAPGDVVEFDETALSSSPIDPSVFNYVERQQPAPPVEPVVDTCATLPTADVEAIATELAERYSFGQSRTFTATTRGAACDYTSDTHLVTLLIGSSADVPSDPLANDAFVPPGAGEVSTTQWADDASIVVLSEDSFDLDTPYGALTTSGDFGIRVDNRGGTAVDDSGTGELYVELVRAAVANVADAPPPPSADDASSTPPGDPCSLWTADELEAFLMGTPFGEPVQPEGSPNSCSWSGWDRGGAGLSVQIFDEATGYGFDGLETVGSTGSVYTFAGGGLPVIVSPDGVTQVTLRIDMLDESIPDDAVVALAENLLMRLG